MELCPPNWTCHACGLLRSNESISVAKCDVSEQLKLPPGTVTMNTRYCSDRPECERDARGRRRIDQAGARRSDRSPDHEATDVH